MKEVIVMHYEFDELSDKAKERAREWWRECESQDFGAHGDIFESAETAAKLLGVTFASVPHRLMGGGTRHEPDIRYSGFGSQGDGASFVGSYAYAKGAGKAVRAEWPQDVKIHAIADDLAAIQKAHGYAVTANVTQRGHCVHKLTMYADVYVRGEDASETVADELLEALRDFAQWIYDGLREDYEYRMSDESVDESIRANEYDFLESGERA